MTDRRPNVLVINQRMDRTGAPVHLATLLQELAGHLDARLTLLAGSVGPLTNVMAPHVDRIIYETLALRAVSRVERHLPLRWRRRVRGVWVRGMRRRAGRPRVVYVNSLISHRLASAFVGLPMIVHVHELGTLAESFGTPAHDLLDHASKVFVPSAVAAEWVAGQGVDRSTIEVLPGTVPATAFEPPDIDVLTDLRHELGLLADTRMVATVGWIGYLKGDDRFLDVAQLLSEREDIAVHLVWVGGGSDSGAESAFRQDIHRRALADVVTILPGCDDLRSIYAAADLILITSREESLSLVALEAAAQGTPVVHFPGSGGPDLLADEGICIRPDGRGVDDVAATIARLLTDPGGAASVGTAAQQAVRHHHAPEVALRPLLLALESVSREIRNDGG